MIFDEADRNRGPIRLARCYELGASRSQIRTLLEKGILKTVCRGIVAPAGATRGWSFDIMAGIKLGEAPGRADGIAAASSAITSCIQHQLLVKPLRPIHVVSTRFVQPREGYRFHRTNRLPTDEVVTVEGLPTTDPTRAFLDVCATHPGLALYAFRRGIKLGSLSPEGIMQRIDRESRQGRTGLARAREIVEGADLRAIAGASNEEDRVFEWIAQEGLPLPERNIFLPSSFGWDWEIDLFYRRPRIVAIEVSLWELHGDPRVFDKDVLKRTDLVAQGVTVLTVSDPEQRPIFLQALRTALLLP